MKLPCIKYKCLKYPVCRHNTTITCDVFRSYFRYMEIYHSTSQAWQLVHANMPQVTFIRNEENTVGKIGDNWFKKL